MSRADLKDLEWYISEFNEADVDDVLREVLEKYSHIPAKSVLNHIISIVSRHCGHSIGHSLTFTRENARGKSYGHRLHIFLDLHPNTN